MEVTDLRKNCKKVSQIKKMNEELKRALWHLDRELRYGKMDKKLFPEFVNFINLQSVSVSEVFKIVLREVQEHGGTGKVEHPHRNIFRKIHIAGAIVQSDLYKNSDDSEKVKALEVLAKPERYNYFNLISYNYLSYLLQKMSSIEFRRLVFPLIQSTLSTSWKKQTVTTLYLLMMVQDAFPDSVPAHFLENNLGTPDILCVDSINRLCQIVKTIPETLNLKHPIFQLLIKKLSASDLVEQFFTKLDLVMTFDDRSEYVTFTALLIGVLENAKHLEVIPDVLTKNYLEQILPMCMPMNGAPDQDFYDLTGRLFDILLCCLKKKPTNCEIVINIVSMLLSTRGVSMFENEHGNAAIDIILAMLTAEGIKELSEIIKNDMFTKAIGDELEMLSIVYFLMELKDFPVMCEESEWKIELLIFVGKIGILKDPSYAVRKYMADDWQLEFFDSIYSEMSKHDNFGYIISKILNEFINAVSGDNWNVLRKPFKPKTQQTWLKAVEEITNLDGSCHDRDIVFHYLCSLFCLLLFDYPKLATKCLSEVLNCYESTKKATEDEIIWMEIVDLYLTLLSHRYAFLTDLINHVFPIVCKHVDSTMLRQILYLLDPDISSIPVPGADENAEEEIEEEEDEDEEDDDVIDDTDEEDEGWSFSEEESVSDEDDASQNEADLLVNITQGLSLTSIGTNSRKKQFMTDYRIRVLCLIDIYLKHDPAMLPTLEIMSDLMRLLQFCVKSGNPGEELSDKVKESLKLLPSLALNESKGVTEEYLVELLTDLFHKCKLKPAVVEKMGDAIVDCSVYVLNCSQILEIVDVENSDNPKKTNLHELMKQTVEVFFTRDSPILYDVLKELFRRGWNRVRVFSLLPMVFRFVLAKHNCHRRDQALKLAKLFFENRQYVDSHLEEMKTVEEDIVAFLAVCGDFFRKLNGKPIKRKFKMIDAKDPFTCDLLQLLCDIKASAVGGMLQTWPDLKIEARDCCSLDLSQDALVALGKFCDESFAKKESSKRRVKRWRKPTHYI